MSLLRAAGRSGLVLRGQVAVDDTGEVFLLASPWLTTRRSSRRWA